jgi:hypothetical protein
MRIADQLASLNKRIETQNALLRKLVEHCRTGQVALC